MDYKKCENYPSCIHHKCDCHELACMMGSLEKEKAIKILNTPLSKLYY